MTDIGLKQDNILPIEGRCDDARSIKAGTRLHFIAIAFFLFDGRLLQNSMGGVIEMKMNAVASKLFQGIENGL